MDAGEPASPSNTTPKKGRGRGRGKGKAETASQPAIGTRRSTRRSAATPPSQEVGYNQILFALQSINVNKFYYIPNRNFANFTLLLTQSVPVLHRTY